MKRSRFLLSFVCLMMFALSMLSLTACSENESPHTHVYDKKIVNDTFKASDATCEDKAEYYFSCSCGEIGTQTFESGEALGHNFTNYISDNNATTTNDGTKTAYCNYGCGMSHSIIEENTKLKVKLMIDYANGKENKIIEQYYNSEIEKIENPIRPGYCFVGWDKTLPTVMPKDDLTLTAKWELIFYLTFQLSLKNMRHKKHKCQYERYQHRQYFQVF